MTRTQQYDVFTPEIWQPRVNEFFKYRLVAAPFFDNYSDSVANGGDIIHIPGTSETFAATAVAVTSGDVTSQALTDTGSVITVNNWMASAFDLSDFQAAQAMKSYRIREKYVSDMGYSLAKKFDTALLTNVSSLSPSVGTSASDIKSTNLENAIAIMESNSVPLTELAWMFHPKPYWKEIAKIQKYYDASQFGSATTEKGRVPTLYGVPIKITENLPLTAGTGRYGALIHNSAFVYALGNLPGGTPSGARFMEKDSESLRKKYVADIAYGVTVLNSKRGVKILSNN